jgi:hypothetical protein
LPNGIETDVMAAYGIMKKICILHNIIIEIKGIERNLKDIAMFSRQNHGNIALGRSTAHAQHVREALNLFVCR